jgi:sialidase-1
VWCPLPDAAAGERLLLFANPVGGHGDGRVNLTLRASRDEGRSWPIARLLDDGPGAYSALAVLRDGTIGVLYETGAVHPYEKITFARLNLEWLLGAAR